MFLAPHLGYVVGLLHDLAGRRAPGERYFDAARGHIERTVHECLVDKPLRKRVERLVEHEQPLLRALELGERGSEVPIVQLARRDKFFRRHGPGKLFRHLPREHGHAEMLGEQSRLPAFAVFQELHDDDAAACGEHAKGEAHRRRGLAFAVAMIHVDHTPSSIMR